MGGLFNRTGIGRDQHIILTRRHLEADISDGAFRLYMHLALTSAVGSLGVPYSLEEMGEWLGKSPATASRYLREMVREGLLEQQRPGQGKPNRYSFPDSEML